MEERINKTVKYLQAEYIMIWILPIVLVILYETGIMTEGRRQTASNREPETD